MYEGHEQFTALRKQIANLTTPDGEPVSRRMSGNTELITVYLSIEGAVALTEVLTKAAHDASVMERL